MPAHSTVTIEWAAPERDQKKKRNVVKKRLSKNKIKRTNQSRKLDVWGRKEIEL
jgi:hypothetical protein